MYLTNKKNSCTTSTAGKGGLKMKIQNKIGKVLGMTATPAMALVACLFVSDAWADGFVCYSSEEQLQIQVYNHTSPADGTRSPSVMIVSDLSQEFGDQLIAKFSGDKGELFADGARYFARASTPISSQEGESSSKTANSWDEEVSNSVELLGYTLSSLLELSLAIDFNYEMPVERGTTLRGVLELVEQNGNIEWLEMDCVRYLR